MDDIDDIVNPDGPPPWLRLLNPLQRAWRETQILKGRDPDSHIERELRRAGRWPERKAKKAKKIKKVKKAKTAKKTKKAKNAKRP